MTFIHNIESDYQKFITVDSSKKQALVDFGATDFNSFKRSLLTYVKAVYPNDYQYFASSDFGIMLQELLSYVGAVLSMKADMYANENFIRTAKNRNNVKKLLELICIRMKGPIGAAGNARITLNSPLAGASSEFTIPKNQRTIVISSPEDNGPLNYTIYKVINGQLDAPVIDNDLIFDVGESVNSTSSVWENVALLEGAFIIESGQFSPTERSKTVALSRSPVIENSAQVFITGNAATSGAWERVENIFFASGATDKVFELVYNDNYQGTIVFGDGIVGLNPAAGDNYSISYRVGGGTRGNIKESVINATITPDLYVGNPIAGVVENISDITGGLDAESVEHAKKYGPLTFRRQDRLVTLDDFKAFSNSFVGSTGTTGKATAATRKAFSSANVIDIFVLQRANDIQLQQATTAFKAELLLAMQQKKMLTDELVIVDGVIRTLDLVCTIHVDKELSPKEEEIKSKVRNNILTYFNVDNFDFGKELSVADLNRSIFLVEEVRFSTIDNLTGNIIVDFNEIIQLNNLTINVTYV